MAAPTHAYVSTRTPPDPSCPDTIDMTRVTCPAGTTSAATAAAYKCARGTKNIGYQDDCDPASKSPQLMQVCCKAGGPDPCGSYTTQATCPTTIDPSTGVSRCDWFSGACIENPF